VVERLVRAEGERDQHVRGIMQPEAPWKPVAQILLALVVPACLVVYSPCLLSNIIVVVFVLAVAAAVFVIAYSAF